MQQYTYKFVENISRIFDMVPEYLPELSDQELSLRTKDFGIVSPMTGRKHTEETKLQMSLSRKGKKVWNKGVTGYHIKPIPPEAIARMRHNLSQDWKITSPNGNVFTVRNLKEFCKKHKLDDTAMVRVASGKRKHHHFWSCVKL